MVLKRYFEHILPVASTAAFGISMLSLLGFVLSKSDLRQEFGFVGGGYALVSILLVFLLGAGSATLANSFKRLSRVRRVFISYSQGAAGPAMAATDAIRKAGVRVWLDVERLKPGDRWDNEIKAAIEDADALVLFIPTSQSAFLHREIELARAKGIRILPVLSADVPRNEMPSEISNLTWIDFRENSNRALRQLVDAVTAPRTSHQS
jgi:hypothetical protein